MHQRILQSRADTSYAARVPQLSQPQKVVNETKGHSSQMSTVSDPALALVHKVAIVEPVGNNKHPQRHIYHTQKCDLLSWHKASHRSDSAH